MGHRKVALALCIASLANQMRDIGFVPGRKRVGVVLGIGVQTGPVSSSLASEPASFSRSA